LKGAEIGEDTVEVVEVVVKVEYWRVSFIGPFVVEEDYMSR
jgi:hypothetical protein